MPIATHIPSLIRNVPSHSIEVLLLPQTGVMTRVPLLSFVLVGTRQVVLSSSSRPSQRLSSWGTKMYAIRQCRAITNSKLATATKLVYLPRRSIARDGMTASPEFKVRCKPLFNKHPLACDASYKTCSTIRKRRNNYRQFTYSHSTTPEGVAALVLFLWCKCGARVVQVWCCCLCRSKGLRGVFFGLVGGWMKKRR